VTSVLTALVFGLVPALKAARKDLNEPLRDSGKGISGGFRHGRLRDAVVVLEVGLSLMLLVAAGLLMRSFVAIRDVKLGLQPDHIFVARLPLPVDRYKTADQVTGFYRPLLQRLKALPGVVEATETSTLPPYGGIPSDIEIPGKTHTEKWNAMFQLVSEGYFGVLKIQFMDGRGFTEAEVNGARKLAVVNQTFVKKYLGNENPIGRLVKIAQLAEFEDAVKEPTFEIIGLVADAKNRGLQDPPEPEIWVPYTVTGSAFRGILVRTANEPLAMMNAVEHEIWATDANVALTLTGTLEGYISQFSYAGPRFGFFLMMIFSAIGLVLVTIGVYSVLAYTTARRTQEIGIRMALGAKSSDVQRMVIRMGLRLVGIGVALGLIAIIYSVWRPSDLAPILQATIRESTMLMMIIGMSLLYSYVMSYLHISQSAAEAIVAMHLPRWELLAAILVMVVVLGFFLPPVSIILMTAPIILPPLRAANFDIIWFGVVMTIVMEMGLIHPPVGLNIFVIRNVAPDIPLSEVIWGTLPFVLLMMLAVLLLCFFPEISTGLPNLVMGPDGGR